MFRGTVGTRPEAGRADGRRAEVSDDPDRRR
jgi:hypothetical protein